MSLLEPLASKSIGRTSNSPSRYFSLFYFVFLLYFFRCFSISLARRFPLRFRYLCPFLANCFGNWIFWAVFFFCVYIIETFFNYYFYFTNVFFFQGLVLLHTNSAGLSLIAWLLASEHFFFSSSDWLCHGRQWSFLKRKIKSQKKTLTNVLFYFKICVFKACLFDSPFFL